MAEQIAAISSAVLDNMRVGSRPTDCLRIVSNPSRPWFLFDEEKAMLVAEKEQDDETAQATLEKYLNFTNSCYENTRRRLVHLPSPAETSGQESVKRERLDDPGEEGSKKAKVDA
ncbi:hypothetical protein PG991_015830 [Apiospora marii]|uniref:Uncharacterized protein n=1 Tax=Apiospora marii TaxID=335849 RepID=A0ABR1R1M6_9PEZI